jgi:hypothetical protein
VIVAVLSPMLFTERTFDRDWSNHLWLARMQGANISADGHPGLFLHAASPNPGIDLGVYYPQFAFYGGTLYAAAGALGLLIGPVAAYLCFFAGGLAASLFGWVWIARQAGIPAPLALVPGVLHITSAYVLANMYGRGAWPEFVAAAMLPLVAASAWALLRSPRIEPWPAAALVVATVFLTGSHNITLVWGAVFLAAVAVAVAVAVGREAVRGIGLRRVAAIGGLMLLAAGLNGWFLLSDLAYAHQVGLTPYDDGAKFFNEARVVLNPLRVVPSESGSPGLTAEAPVVALGWSVAALALCGAGALTRAWRRLGAALGLLLLGFLSLVLRDDPTVGAIGRFVWGALPSPLRYVQFAFRLQTYVTLLVCGLVVVALAAIVRAPRGARRTGLVSAVAIVTTLSLYQAVHQAWRQPSFSSTRSFLTDRPVREVPVTWSDPGNFRDHAAPVIAATRRVHLDPDLVAEGRGVRLPSGSDTVATNIGAGPSLVRLEGADPVGRLSGGQMVIRPVSPAADLRVRAARTVPVVFGELLTLASALTLGGAALVRRRRDRRAVRHRRAEAG